VTWWWCRNQYAAGIPGNGKPFPDGAKALKMQYYPKKSTEAPFDVSPDGKGARCGAACHSAVKAKDYVFTAFQKR